MGIGSDSVGFSSTPQGGLVYAENTGGLLNRGSFLENPSDMRLFEGREGDGIANPWGTD